MTLTGLLRRVWADESGATAIEYALICGIMSVALVAVAAAGGALDGMFDALYQIIDVLLEVNGGDAEPPVDG